ncbi:MAG: hypothetical protein R3Y23_01405 [Bacillota bacterium]
MKLEITDKCLKFYAEILKDSEARYKSWEYCYMYFQKNKDKANDKEILDKMCLHLAFYLASWGMLRGSSFLLKKSYKVHVEAINIMMNDKYKILHNIKAQELIQNMDLLFECGEEVSLSYEKQYNCKIPSDTLITKIFLGIYGCVPAYDRYFKDAVKSANYCAKFNKKSISQMCSFYNENIAEFNNIKKEIKNDLYTDMKLIDMYFWQIGKEESDKSI